jgi:hypothetical protein
LGGHRRTRSQSHAIAEGRGVLRRGDLCSRMPVGPGTPPWRELAVSVYLGCPTGSQDLHSLGSAVRLCFNQNELAIVIEVQGVRMDRLERQVILGKVSLKGFHDGVLPVLSAFWPRLRFRATPNHRRGIAWSKDHGAAAATAGLSLHDHLIVNSVFESRASQSLNGLVQIAGVVEYTNYSSHCQTAIFPAVLGEWHRSVKQARGFCSW